MSNPTLFAANFQKHVRANAPYRTNTFLEQTELIIGSSSRLRGFSFVSENVGTDVTLSAGDFISVGHILDASQPTRSSGIMVRTLVNAVIDTSGFTDPAIFGFVQDSIELAANPVEFLVTEAAPAPDIRYAPLIFKDSGTWYQNKAIGNDELGNSSILASGFDTIPPGINSTVTITHNLGLASYKVLLQSFNLSDPVYTLNGLTVPTQVGEIWPKNQLLNSFDVSSDSSPTSTFYWIVVA
jgi:hypothetical protein